MKKLFISQPMRGLTDKEIIIARQRIWDAAIRETGEQYQVIPSFVEGRDFDEKNKPIRYLAESIKMLADADAAVFGWRWQEARGCRIEHQICEDYSIPIIELPFPQEE